MIQKLTIHSDVNSAHFKTGAFVAFKQGAVLSFMEVKVQEKISHLHGDKFILTGNTHLGCPVIQPSGDKVDCLLAEATQINVQHQCNEGCKIRDKARGTKIESSRHRQLKKHTADRLFCINIYSIKTRKVVSSLIEPSEVIPEELLKEAIINAYIPPKTRGKKKIQKINTKSKGKKRARKGDSSSEESEDDFSDNSYE